jgi:hypothetical protein
MKPSVHSNLLARKYGGIPSDYQEVHDFLDMSKMTHSDLRHRCILHNTLGPFLAEKGIGVNHSRAEYLKKKYGWSDEEYQDVLSMASDRSGTTIVNADGAKVSVREIAEQHIIQDMGEIPSVSKYLDGMPLYEWLGHGQKVVRKIVMRASV